MFARCLDWLLYYSDGADHLLCLALSRLRILHINTILKSLPLFI